MKNTGWKHRLSNLDLNLMMADCQACGPGIRIVKADRIRCWEGRQKGGTYGKYTLTYSQKKSLFGVTECPICLSPLDYFSAHLDHCHDTGELRGFICSSCNLGLGKLGDSIESLERALEYVKNSRLTVNDE